MIGTMSNTSTHTGGAEVIAFDQSLRRTHTSAGAPMEFRRGRSRWDIHRPLYSVPGFTAAVGRALKLRPDLTRADLVAVGREIVNMTVVVGESLVSIVDDRRQRSAKSARGRR